jgi:hypothetical protein
MPVEIIGEAGTPGASREWIDAECQLAIKHLNKVCGEHPAEMELEVQWQEHDLGGYPTIVLIWEDAMRRPVGVHRKVRGGPDRVREPLSSLLAGTVVSGCRITK